MADVLIRHRREEKHREGRGRRWRWESCSSQLNTPEEHEEQARTHPSSGLQQAGLQDCETTSGNKSGCELTVVALPAGVVPRKWLACLPEPKQLVHGSGWVVDRDAGGTE